MYYFDEYRGFKKNWVLILSTLRYSNARTLGLHAQPVSSAKWVTYTELRNEQSAARNNLLPFLLNDGQSCKYQEDQQT